MKINGRFLVYLAGIISLFGFIALCIFPIRDTFIRISICILAVMIWLSVLCLIWVKKKIRWTFLGLTGSVFLFLCMPSHSIPSDKFRDCYVHCLKRYESVDYLWGAESWAAIDCSGLIRQGYIDALWVYGLKTFNGAMIREGLLVWAYDSSAKALRDGYRLKTVQVMEVRSLNSLDSSQIKPGDFAVIRSGVHCLAYLGDNTWIQADPAVKKVVINHVPANSSWFEASACIMRWSMMEN
jgi:hypothetical protein